MLIKKFLFIGAIVFSIQSVLSQEIEKKEYYDNGGLKCVYSIDKNGMKMGEEKLFDKSGVLKEKKKWLEGKVIDTIYRYHKLPSEDNLDKKLVQGFDKDDNMIIEGIKINDMWDGNLYYYRNGVITSTKSFKKNIEKGIVLLFDEETNKLKYLYQSNNKKRDGIKIEFDDYGKLKSFRESNIYSNGQYIEFFDDGSIKLIGYRRKGKSDGWFYYFNEAGWITSKKFYSMGELIDISN